ncbi:MAG: methyltransferase [Proteobacteria bacterium]|nr:methyltransferase [Pseudomonadota bacterium]
MKSAKEKIADSLERSIGLEISTIGDSTFARAVNSRMKALGIAEVDAYAEKFSASTAELRQLVEEVVIPETWFFRDQVPFTLLGEHVLNTEKFRQRYVFRILSLPCATGEEPYSIAMTLLQAGLPPSCFYIDAVDVSERVLVLARRAVYRENSFRSRDLAFRQQFFHKTDKGFELNKTVREKVRFLKGNILHPAFMEGRGRYDVVFCRNVLIYFSEEAQQQAISALYHILMPGGLLFTGYAESNLFFGDRFIAAGRPKAFAFYKKESAAATAARQDDAPDDTGEDSFREPSLPAGRKSKPVFDRPAARPAGKDEDFNLARQLADEGKLAEAARRSEQYLQEHAPSARWYYLLGVIRDSEGQAPEALKLFRKAVYLDPGHVESLLQLSLLAERAGDLAGAANYRRRAQRLQEGG